MKQYRLSVVVEKDADGYFVFCPELQGCYLVQHFKHTLSLTAKVDLVEEQ